MENRSSSSLTSIASKQESAVAGVNQENTLACVELHGTQHEDVSIVATLCGHNQVILSTAVVYVKNSKNAFISCRVLLDSGSHINFISKNLANKLGLKIEKIDVPISGVSQMISRISYKTQAMIKSLYNEFTANLSFLVLERVTANLPVTSFQNNLNIPPNLNLADPEFNISAEVDMLIGAGLFFDLLCVGQIRLGKQQPILQKSLLGWIISGNLGTGKNNIPENKIVCHSLLDNDLQNQLEKFWNVEDCSINKNFYSKEENECEEQFVKTVIRDKSGRFCVTLPVRDNLANLGNSLQMATNRFLALERKLSKNEVLRTKYCDFMKEYLELGHMSKIEADDVDSNLWHYYLPHHGVFNESSLTTKLRVVFDASVKTSSGISLNEVLKIGPNIQDELFSILIRFRKHNVVVTADIAKMYRQVNITGKQRDLQRIIWRADSNADIEHFRLNTITYGTASASFLATRCLLQVALDIKETLPDISKTILRDFYVDDLITGANSISEAIDMSHKISDELNKYGFPLRKWSSNKIEVLEHLVGYEKNDMGYFIADDERKMLGIFWKAKQDVLKYVVRSKYMNRNVTKRLILSIISQVFDPLGLVGPVTIRAKVLLQKLWQLQLGWDETIPLELLSSWTEFYSNLETLNEIEIPRQVITQDATEFEIHGFCDASEIAYGACIYIRTVRPSGDICSRLLCAKSRVAPLRVISLPRLELCGAVLLARLTKKVVSAIDLQVKNIFYWCDSTIVLSWLKQQPSNWKVFVANRVSEIQNTTDVHQWAHVSSCQNPADIISRGIKPNQLRQSTLWWEGPEWLNQGSDKWLSNTYVNPVDIPEQRNHRLVLTSLISDSSIFDKFSTLWRLKRVVAWCSRFYDNARRERDKRDFSKLSIDELNRALTVLIRVMQEVVFNEEIQSIRKSNNVARSNKIKTLDPFLDQGNLLRVGGRIRNANISYDARFQIIFPPQHKLTRLIIMHQHLKQLHAGAQTLLATIRQQYWPINGRNSVRSVLSKCIICFRVKPRRIIQKMGNLPASRLIPQRPFSICGVDCAGPFNVKDGKLRNRAIIKGYMCLFICFTTKAVHIELVGYLSTNSFLNCLKRFISRRGLCSHIYSDNATNFTGANNELRKITRILAEVKRDDKVNNFCVENNIRWHFIPARSPHHGGLWEAAIKSAKYHITRIVGNVSLTFEDLSTIFAQVEAILNSRPLTPLSCDPKDLLALTPGHFLIGDALNAMPQGDVREYPFNRLTHYHALQQMVQHFWSRWSQEYLATLQERFKWQGPYSNSLEIGTMVLMRDNNTAPMNWKIGRIEELHPGKDGLIRVISVRLSSGVVKRAIQNVCVLPIEENC